jgi:hypothetical protein
MNRWITPYRFAAVASIFAVYVIAAQAQSAQEGAPDQPVSVAPAQLTLIQVVPYLDEMHAVPEVASCYRIGRCSAYDLYRFSDRPNRLTRLAPQAPPDARPPSVYYVWYLAPVTPNENIVPEHQSASQVRDEYRAFGAPIDAPN